MSDKHTPTQHETPRQQLPGQLLRQAREKQGMEPKEIATQLNLQTDIIIALEADDAGKLPAPTYVRGYIRSYARIVHLDGDALIRLYDQDAVEPPEIIPDIKNHAQASSNDKPVKAFTYLVTFALALLLIAWLLQSHYTNKEPAASADSAADVTANESEPLPDWTAPQPVTEYSAPATRLSTFSETAPLSDTTVPAESDTTVDSSGLISTIGMPDTGSGIESATPEALTADPVTASDHSTENQINLKISKDSWVEIYDAANTRLYLGLATAGEEISVSGTAPYDVLLGYSPGVQVTFNGKPFDPRPFSTSGVAKFTLAPATDTVEDEETE